MTAAMIDETVALVGGQLALVVHGSRAGVRRIATAATWRLSIDVATFGPDLAAFSPQIARLIALYTFLGERAS